MMPMLDCQAVMRQLWAYLDGELTDDRVAAIEAHLAVCKRCHPQYDFERGFLEQLSRARREHSNPNQLRTRLVDALRGQGFARS